MAERAPSVHETDEQPPSSKGLAIQRTSGSQEGTEKQQGSQVLKMGSEHQKCAEQSGQDRFVRGYRGTIKKPSSKMGKKGMCRKWHGREGH